MVKLVGYELRKHFMKPSIFIALLLFSVVSVVKIYGVYAENSLFARGLNAEESAQIKALYWEMYEDFGGDITLEKINQLLEIYRPIEAKVADRTASTADNNPDTYTGNFYHDYFFFDKCFVKPMEHDYMYKSYANEVFSAAQENIGFYQSVGNSYGARKNAILAKSFSGRQVTDFYFTEMYQYYTHYDFSSFLILLLCLYGLVGVFVSEKEVEMDTLLLTTKRGGTHTVTAKLIASALFVVSVCLWFSVLDFFAFGAVFGSFAGVQAPLYAIINFADTALNVNLGQYALLSAVLKTVGMLVLGLGFLLLSCLFRNGLFPFGCGLVSAFGLMVWQGAFMGSGYIWGKVLNPFMLMVNREFFRKSEFVNVFSFPVPSYVAALCAGALWAAVFAVGISLAVKKSTIPQKGGVLHAA